jgi:predicted RNA-binding Zn-ribbon protein involved in translation (DUF1610 family)
VKPDLWNSDGLWEKARVAVVRAQDEEYDAGDRGLWYVLALEYLARASLAKVHPVLLADPQEGKNILYAFGVPTDRPKSVPAKTVFLRCQSLLAGFTEEDFKLSVALSELRNEELHSAGLPFEAYPLRAWQAEFYRIAQKLCEALGQRLVDLFGTDEAAAAELMLEHRASEVLHEVKEAISASRTAFMALLADDQQSRREMAATSRLLPRNPPTTRVDCPACGSSALLRGEGTREMAATFDEETGDVLVRTIAVPVGLECPACGLDLQGHARISAAEIGGEFVVQSRYNPIDYFGIEIDPADYFEEEYGND